MDQKEQIAGKKHPITLNPDPNPLGFGDALTLFQVKKQALSFSNPMIPYKWEHLDQKREGLYCIFNADLTISLKT